MLNDALADDVPLLTGSAGSPRHRDASSARSPRQVLLLALVGVGAVAALGWRADGGGGGGGTSTSTSTRREHHHLTGHAHAAASTNTAAAAAAAAASSSSCADCYCGATFQEAGRDCVGACPDGLDATCAAPGDKCWAKVNCTAPAPSLSCTALSSRAIQCEWSAVPGAKRYHISLSAPPAATAAAAAAAGSSSSNRPFAIRTSAANHLAVDDLLPGTRYAVSVRVLPAEAPSFVWGWRDLLSGDAPPVVVRTLPSAGSAAAAAAEEAGPYALRRAAGTGAAATEASLTWELPAALEEAASWAAGGAAGGVVSVAVQVGVATVSAADAARFFGGGVSRYDAAVRLSGIAAIAAQDAAAAAAAAASRGGGGGGGVRGGGAAAAAAAAAATGPPLAPLAWTWHAAAAPTAHTLRGLAPDSVLLLRVRAAISTAAPPTTHRTASHEYTTTRRTTHFVPPAPAAPATPAAPAATATTAATTAAAAASSFDGALVLRTLRDDGTLYTTAFRISEYDVPSLLATRYLLLVTSG